MSHLNVTLKLFEDYLTQSVSKKYLAQIHGLSRTTLWRRFALLLDIRMTPISPPYSRKPKIVIVDGFYLAYPSLRRNRHKTGFNKDKCILLWAIDSLTHRPIYWQFYDATEDMGIWKRFIKEMKSHKINPNYLVHDGHPGITNACLKYWPKTKQQRCLVHFMGNMNKDLSISPKTELAKNLKRLVASLFKVRNAAGRIAWERQWLNYSRDNQATIFTLLNRKNAYEGSVRISGQYASAYSVINNAYNRNEIFTYLGNNKVPNTSNAIESLNAILRELIRRHRGLSLEQRKNLVSWALTYRKGYTKTQIKQQINNNLLKKDTHFET
jgi:transposase-like protein